MKLCDGGFKNSHPEIAHDERICPLCEAMEKAKSDESEIEKLKEKIGDLESDLLDIKEQRDKENS